MSITRIEEALRKAKEARQASSSIGQPRDEKPPAPVTVAEPVAAPAPVGAAEPIAKHVPAGAPEPVAAPAPASVPVLSTAPPVAPVARRVAPPATATPGMSFRFADGRIVEVPFTRLRKNRVVTMGDRSQWVARFRDLQAATVATAGAETEAMVIAVMSANPREGRTLCAINLAVSMATSSAEPVVLVDMDFYKPALHAYLEVYPATGLTEFLEGSTKFDDILIHAEAGKLVIVPAGRRSREYATFLARDNVSAIIEALRKRFPLSTLVVDLPPLSLNVDPSMLDGIVDHVVLVAEEGKTPQDDVRRALEKLKNVKHVGLVLNKAVESSI